MSTLDIREVFVTKTNRKDCIEDVKNHLWDVLVSWVLSVKGSVRNWQEQAVHRRIKGFMEHSVAEIKKEVLVARTSDNDQVKQAREIDICT